MNATKLFAAAFALALIALSAPALAAAPRCPAFGASGAAASGVERAQVAPMPHLDPDSAAGLFWDGILHNREQVAEGTAVSLFNLPAYDGPIAQGERVRRHEIAGWHDVGAKIERGAVSDGMVDGISYASIYSVGRAHLTELYLRDPSDMSPTRPSESRLRLAFLPSGQPVAALPLHIGAGRPDDPRAALDSDRAEILMRLAIAAHLGLSGQFYGVQLLGPSLAVALIELPPRGRLLRSETSAADFRLRTYEDIESMATRLRDAGFDVDPASFDFRPFVATRSGRLVLLPDARARYGLEADIAMRPAARVAAFGVSLTEATRLRLREETRGDDLRAALFPYLSILSEARIGDLPYRATPADLRAVTARLGNEEGAFPELRQRIAQIMRDPSVRDTRSSHYLRLMNELIGLTRLTRALGNPADAQGPRVIDVGRGYDARMTTLRVGDFVAIGLTSDVGRTSRAGYELGQVVKIERDAAVQWMVRVRHFGVHGLGRDGLPSDIVLRWSEFVRYRTMIRFDEIAMARFHDLMGGNSP